MPLARLSDVLSPESVLVPLTARSMEEAVKLLVEALPLTAAQDRGGLEAAVLTRERAGSTGLGSGIAVPHARTTLLTVPRLAVGVAAVPLDFKAADGRPVDLVFLLAAPAEDSKAHLRSLAALSRVGSDVKLLARLRRAGSAAAIYSLLADLPV
ncbi:MAG: PTS sugar transporter subunit IIA [Elusimicrobia bacterium]|nr:PTS sugar transporter subunit IIA [Elusimicrobiota bacterium]